MSGITGIYNLDGRPVDRELVKAMNDSIAHRGPDGEGNWMDGAIGLGQQMLCTTPESIHEKLPMTNKTGDIAITADARIDNRSELITVLNFNGSPRGRITDSEIILAAYEKWGECCPKKLIGDFAFGIWDGRKKRIFCARDQIGIKPFHYFFNGKTLRWASEPKAIFGDNEIPKEVNLSFLCLYLLNQYDEREETVYKNIYRLPPSHFMVIENGRLHKEQYWDIDPNCAINYQSDGEYTEHFLALFKEAVHSKLRSHRPVGALLSGGLDSSSIVCIAQELYKEKVQNGEFETFSVLFDNLPCDERGYIDEVVRKWSIEANYLDYEKHPLLFDLKGIRTYPDMLNLSVIILLAPVFMSAKQKGIRVMLDGIGGDDLLAVDVDHLTDLFSKKRIPELMSQLKSDAELFSTSSLSMFIDYCIKPLIPQSMRSVLQRILPFRKNGIPSWINAEFVKQVGVEKRIQRVSCSTRFPSRAQQHIHQVMRFGWNTNVALDMIERLAANFGVECRHPFFDVRLVEFLFAIPEEQRWSRKWPKAVLRHSMLGILPESVRTRKDKADFTCVIDRELRNRRREEIEDLIEESSLVNLGVINKNEIRKIFRKHQNGNSLDRVRNSIESFIWMEVLCRSVMYGLKKGGENVPAERLR
jgi:asparagine synthase (glutamine-hydrolysing)